MPAKALFPDKFNPSGANNFKGHAAEIVKRRYEIYVSEAQSGKHVSQREALLATALRLGLKPSSGNSRIRKQFIAHRLPLIELKMPELPVEEPVTVEDALRKALEEKKAELDRHISLRLRDVNEIKRLKEAIWHREREDERVADASSMRFNPFVIAPSLHAPSSPGFPMTIWSDIHCGEEVRLSEMGGLNVYNREVMFERADKLVTGTIKLLRNYAGLRPEYPGMWINLGGDLISGGIHEELRETNWGTIEEQAVDIGECLISCLLAMAGEFATEGRKIYVPCVVGNHGRHSLKPVAKRHVRENREWGVYRSIARQLADDTRFEFFIPDTPDFHYEVYGHRFMLTHGNQIGAKGGDGHIGAVGPITRGTMKTGRAEAQVNLGFDTMVIGHWHSYQPRGALVPTITNGCWKGFDEFAKNVLRVPFSPAQQALWLVSPSHGIVNQTPVDLS